MNPKVKIRGSAGDRGERGLSSILPGSSVMVEEEETAHAPFCELEFNWSGGAQ